MIDEIMRVSEVKSFRGELYGGRELYASYAVLSGPGGKLVLRMPGVELAQMTSDIKPGQRLRVTVEIVDPPPEGWKAWKRARTK